MQTHLVLADYSLSAEYNNLLLSTVRSYMIFIPDLF
jgi:hypothetical protein